MLETITAKRLDSPKCLTCLEEGKIGQTYKVVRKQSFKCQSCGKIYSVDFFQPEDFTWRIDKKWIIKTKSLFEAKKSKIGLNRLKELEETLAN